MTFDESVVIDAEPTALFRLSQDYGRRLEWDPFLRSANLVGDARAADVGVRALCVSRSGWAMETEYPYPSMVGRALSGNLSFSAANGQRDGKRWRVSIFVDEAVVPAGCGAGRGVFGFPACGGPDLPLGRRLDDNAEGHASGGRLNSRRISSNTYSAGRPRPACTSSRPWRMPSSTRASSASSR
jgi:hypothetical protein